MHDYTRKAGVEETFIVAPEGAPSWARDRGMLWNAAEAAERRGNSVTAREWELALPAEITAAERGRIAREFAQALVERYGVAADVAIHAPHRDGDARNHHAHVLTSTRVLGADGFAEKTRVLDAAKTGGPEIIAMREHWAGLQNDALERARVAERVDHRSLEAQRRDALSRGDALAAETLDRAPEVKLGPAINAMERREMRAAEAEGREYEPVTARGAVVHAARQAREAFAKMRDRLEAVREGLEAARETYQAEREAGQGRVSAGLAALRAAAEKDRGREAPGDGADRDDMRERLGRVMGREVGARERDGTGRDGGPREAARERDRGLDCGNQILRT